MNGPSGRTGAHRCDLMNEIDSRATPPRLLSYLLLTYTDGVGLSKLSKANKKREGKVIEKDWILEVAAKMAAIKHNLQRDLFKPSEERLYAVVSVTKAGKKKRASFLCVAGKILICIRFISSTKLVFFPMFASVMSCK